MGRFYKYAGYIEMQAVDLDWLRKSIPDHGVIVQDFERAEYAIAFPENPDLDNPRPTLYCRTGSIKQRDQVKESELMLSLRDESIILKDNFGCMHICSPDHNNE